MNSEDVARLARHEASVWSRAEREPHTDVPRHPSPPHDTGDGWTAYQPIGQGDRAPQAEHSGFRFKGTASIGTVLVFHFSWHDQRESSDYLLHVDMADIEPPNLDAASTRVLERVEFLLANPDWPRRRSVPISPTCRLVLPVRL